MGFFSIIYFVTVKSVQTFVHAFLLFVINLTPCIGNTTTFICFSFSPQFIIYSSILLTCFFITLMFHLPPFLHLLQHLSLSTVFCCDAFRIAVYYFSLAFQFSWSSLTLRLPGRGYHPHPLLHIIFFYGKFPNSLTRTC
jgi:hypothetical protein